MLRKGFGFKICFSTVMSRIHSLTRTSNDLIRAPALLSLWIALHLYAARPLLVAAAAAGIWPPVPLVSRLLLLGRRSSRRVTVY